MRTLADELYQGWRSWLASLKAGPSTAIIVLTLAVAIGATTAMFVLVKALLNVVPYRNSDQLVMLGEAVKHGPSKLRFSIPDYLDFAAQNRSFNGLGIFAEQYSNLLAGDHVERMIASRVGTGFFSVLGVRMLSGRDAFPDDVSVALISERLWRSHFAGWKNPVGKVVRVDGVDRRIIGIIPRGEEFPPRDEIWLPFVPDAASCRCNRSTHSFQVIGQLKKGVSLGTAAAELKAIAARLAAQYPDTDANTTAWLQPLRDYLIGGVKPAMRMLLAATASMLLMACVSVASIFFARGAYRGLDVAVRQALGASRRRIIGELLAESSFSGLAASFMGLFVAWGTLRVFVRIVPASLSRVRNVSLDLRALGFAVAVALATALISNLLPTLYAARGSLMTTIRSSGLVRVAGGSQRMRSALIVIENAVAFGLLFTSILLFTSLVRLTNVNPGFRSQGVVSGDLNLSSGRYSSSKQVISFYNTLLDQLRRQPGIEAAAAVSALPMTGSTEGMPYYAVGVMQRRAGEESIAPVSYVTPDYFRIMGIPLLRGRDFNYADGQQSHVVVISEGIARASWPNADPIGKRIGIKGAGSLSWEVIGLVPDVKDAGLAARQTPRIYMNEEEVPEKAMAIVVLAGQDPEPTAMLLRHEVNALDPGLPISNVRPIRELVNDSLSRNRTITRVIGAFAAIVLILAAAGVYGIMLSNLMRRTKEFGIRMALGSTSRHIAWLILRDGLLLVLFGIIAGLFTSFASSRMLTGLLFGVGKADVPSYLGAAIGQLLVIVIGCISLLRRITKLDPIVALREQ